MRIGSLLLVVVLFVLVMAAIAVLKGKRPKLGQRFKAKEFLTPNELEFLNRLERAVPELRFHAQVAMGALLEPVGAKRNDVRAHMSARGSFSQKIVDYVAQNRESGTVVAIIELDDRTHDSAKDARRDAMLQEAGYSTVRWTSKAKPDTNAIRQRLLVPSSVVPSSSAARIA
jgi:hypothetical protein